MRNGSGAEWFCLFHEDGWAGLKGLGHESDAWSQGRAVLSSTLQRAIPETLRGFSAEAAFRWDATSVAYYCLGDREPWERAADRTKFSSLTDTGETLLMSLVLGAPDDYVANADSYFEREIDPSIVADAFSLRALTPEIAEQLNPCTDWSAIETELFEEIGYPRRKA